VTESNLEKAFAAGIDIPSQALAAGLPEPDEDQPESHKDQGAKGTEQADAWPYKKVLLAVLPPTLALVSVLIGIWDTGNRDRAAQAEAEKDRAAAAQEAELARAAEVQKNQETAEKESRLREAELVLPKYVDLLEAVHATMSVTSRCASAVNANLTGSSGWDGGTSIGTAVSGEPGGPLETGINPAVVDSCSNVEATIDPLELSFDQALLVSDDSLEGAASGLIEALRASSETANHLLAAIRTDVDGQFYVTDSLDTEGRSWEEVAVVLTDHLATIDPLADDLIANVQAVVVDLEP